MVDEQAVYAAIQGYASVGPMRAPDTWTFDAIKAAIEAYEAAKPSPWRPISEAPDVRPDIMVWFPTPTDPYHPWMMLHGRDCWAPDKEAMFRTIDPPSPASTPPAAEDES